MTLPGIDAAVERLPRRSYSLFGAALLWHSMQGVQVVLEDYVRGALRATCIAVARLLHERPGDEVTLVLGGHHRYSDDPVGALRLTGRVRRVTDGRFHALGPVYPGMSIELGACVVFDIGTAQLVLAATMFAGRIGTVTLAAALAQSQRRQLFRRPEERPIVG